VNAVDITTRDKVIANIQQVLAATRDRLPAENVSDAEELLEHGEWGQAFDLVCTQLYEYEVRISEALYRIVEEAGIAMDLDDGQWSYLKELVA
jgi:hypothetical protein